MIPKPVEVKPLTDFRIWLRYQDGTEGTIDLSDVAGRGVFAAWNDPAFFRSVRLGSHGAIEWGANIDICPDAMYLRLTGKSRRTSSLHSSRFMPEICRSTALSSRCTSPITRPHIFTLNTLNTKRGSPSTIWRSFPGTCRLVPWDSSRNGRRSISRSSKDCGKRLAATSH